MRLQLTPVALSDLKRLRQFIAVKNPQAAQRYSQSLRRSLKNLASQPNIGRLVDEELNIRELIAGDYLARYRVMGDSVVVFKVRHTKEADI